LGAHPAPSLTRTLNVSVGSGTASLVIVMSNVFEVSAPVKLTRSSKTLKSPGDVAVSLTVETRTLESATLPSRLTVTVVFPLSGTVAGFTETVKAWQAA
jgi:hypothetical protein